MAARLAEVSLWLATMHAGQSAPWFGARLGAGNSLVGARLAVWESSDLNPDEGLAKALSKKLKSHAERSDLEEAIEELLVAAEPTAADAVAAVRDVFARAKLAAGSEIDSDTDSAEGESEEDGEDGENGESAQGAEKPAADQRIELLRHLKKTVQAFKRPRYQRKPPVELSLADVLGGKHSRTSIYHFLLPDPGMSPFDKDRVVKELVPDAVATLSAWRKTLDKPFAKADGQRLVAISRRIDQLLAHALDDRQAALSVSGGPVDVWGQPSEASPFGGWRSIDKRIQAHGLAKADGRAYGRLREVMNLWAAQWAWPIEYASSLPTRQDWWTKVEAILGVEATQPNLAEQLKLDAGTNNSSAVEVLSAEAELANGKVTDPVALALQRIVPFHWPLEFPEVFAKGGFDLVIGNPPWIRVQWNELAVLGDLDPRLALDKLSPSAIPALRKELVGTAGNAFASYSAVFEATEGLKGVLGAVANFHLLLGMKPNLYKCFIVHGWRLCANNGVLALVHQDGVFDDPFGGALREHSSVRLRQVCRFQNWLSVFPEVMITRRFCLSVWSSVRSDPDFWLLANVFHPSTVDDSWAHDGEGEVPGIKTPDNQFERTGHRLRLVRVREEELALFAILFDVPRTFPRCARVPNIHSLEVLRVLKALARHPKRLRDLGADVCGALMWYETKAQEDGTIRRETRFPRNADEWILSGPHIYIANPYFKTPRSGCRTPRDYDPLELVDLSTHYLPRTNYVPACSLEEYVSRIPTFKGRPVTNDYRHIHRGMVSLTAERTFTPAIIPPGPAHLHTLVTFSFSDRRALATTSGFWCSILVDFFVRAKGAGHLPPSQSRLLPVPSRRELAASLAARALRLNCLTESYRDLWEEQWPWAGTETAWSNEDRRLSIWPAPDDGWTSGSATRNAFERRMALVEIDALAALELGVSCEELCGLYRVEFPVARKNENETWYDRWGRIAFTIDPSLSGVGLSRQDFERWQATVAAGEPAPADIDTKGLESPFDRCNREDDMRRAYYCFAGRLGIDIPDPVETPSAA